MKRHRLTDSLARRAKHTGPKRYTDIADAELRGFFLRVTSAGTKSWMLRHRGTGKREFFGHWPEVKADEARDLATDIRRGGPVDRVTIAKAVEHYRANYSTAQGRRPDDSSNTRGRLALIVKHLGSRPIEDVKPDEVRRMLASKADFPVEQNRTLAQLSSLYSYADREGWHSGPKPTRAISRNPETPRNRRVLPSERSALLGAMRAIATPVPRGVIELVAEYGARISEICNLKWTDVMPGRVVIRATKTGTSRSLPLTDIAKHVLSERKLADFSETWVFARGPNQAAIRRGSVARWWVKARCAVGINDVRIHDLRHERATHWLMEGHSPAVVAKVAGHKDVRTTLTVYQDVVESDVFEVFSSSVETRNKAD